MLLLAYYAYHLEERKENSPALLHIVCEHSLGPMHCPQTEPFKLPQMSCMGQRAESWSFLPQAHGAVVSGVCTSHTLPKWLLAGEAHLRSPWLQALPDVLLGRFPTATTFSQRLKFTGSARVKGSLWWISSRCLHEAIDPWSLEVWGSGWSSNFLTYSEWSLFKEHSK